MLFESNAKAQTSDYRIQAIFVSSFIKQIQWPASSSTTKKDFVIGVFSSRQVTNILKEKLANIKASGDRKVTIKQISSETEGHDCDILFVPATSRVNMTTISKEFAEKPVLIVTEKDGMLEKGSDINLTLVNNQPRFQINTSNLDKKNLKTSAYLLRLALQ
ncbi:MAG: hypothetical protein OHK0038_22750 [Flammeovirgaceae bacterium]